MRERLIVRFPYLPEQPASWALCDADGRLQGGVYQGDWSQCAAAAAGRQVVLLVPAADVLLAHASVPTRNRGRLLQAIPYALEEQLAEDVATLHFAIGPERPDGTLAVAVVARERMDAWLEPLQGEGLRPDLVVPENLALPLEDRGWSVLVEEGDALVRFGPVEGGYAEATHLPLLLDAALKEAGDTPPQRLQLTVVGSAQGLETLIGVETVRHDAASALQVFAAGLSESPELELLQGAYSRREQLGRWWRPWRAAAILAAVWVVLQGGLGGFDIWRLKGEIARQDQQIAQVFQSAMPGSRRTAKPLDQMDQKLRELRGGGSKGGPLELLAGVSEVLQGDTSARLNAASFRGGRLDLDLELKDIQALDRIKQRTTQRLKAEAEIVSASTQGDKVTGRLRVGGGS